MESRSPTESTNGDPRYREAQSGFWKLQLITEVRDDGVYVRFAPLQRSFRRIAFEAIERVEAATYSAAEHGGWHWGIRLSPTGGSTVYRLDGRDGVRVTRTDGKRVFVGSRTPERLADAIAGAMEGSR